MSTGVVVAWNTMAQVIGKAIGAGVTLLISVLIARAYGVSGYGDYTKVTTFVAFFYLLSDFGLNAIFLREYQDNAGSEDRPWPVLLGLRLLGGVVLIFLCLSILVFFPTGQSQGYTTSVKLGIILFSPTILFQAVITSANALFQKTLRYDLATVAIAVGSSVALVLTWLITITVVTYAGLLFAIAALLAGTATTGATALIAARRMYGPLAVSFDFTRMARLLRAALPVGVALVCNLVYFRADSIILALTRSTQEVGIYALAYKVFEFPLAVPTFFMNAVYPLFLKAKANNQQSTNNKQQFLKLLKQSFVFLVISSLFFVLLLWLAAPLLTFIQPEFEASIPALRVLSLGLPFFFLSSLAMWLLITLGAYRPLVGIYAVLMVGNIVLNVLFIPRFGYMAASWITVLSEAGVLFFSAFWLGRAIVRKPPAVSPIQLP